MRAAEVREKTGITYRQLDHWTRKGILPDQDRKGPGTGKQRNFTEDDVATILRITSLAKSLQSLGVVPQRFLTPSERVEAVSELLSTGMDRHKAINFIDRWLPIKAEA